MLKRMITAAVTKINKMINMAVMMASSTYTFQFGLALHQVLELTNDPRLHFCFFDQSLLSHVFFYKFFLKVGILSN